jgi:hypothetical protein
LGAELPVFQQLEERLLLRWSDAPRPAGGILPESDDFPAETLARRGCLECGVGLVSILGRIDLEGGIEKHGQHGDAPNIQICDRNRTI